MAMEKENHLGFSDWKTYIVAEPLGRRRSTRNVALLILPISRLGANCSVTVTAEPVADRERAG
ncbi:hypothetical protein DPMN_164489 [Dreissena polymorpha]|uniref:Uncharacterized protein n=1 Tax=Dreissena polymorpha TaxID=45954 RepID=A0A9D4IVN9_DREPO|nr:hypothetical protein DPMN_164489 [Dreissena polymorpha]